MKDVVIRVARGCANVDTLSDQYVRGLGFEVLSRWCDHDGFDGVVLGHTHAWYHLEFVRSHHHPHPPPPHREHCLVFYIDATDDWQARCEAMNAAGFVPVANDNSYWERNGRTFVDADGRRAVLNRGAWRR